MTSVVNICNQAGGWVGADPIISLDDDAKLAKLCKVNFAPIRDAVLEARNWTFATKRIILPASATAPVFGFAKAYPIPSTMLRVISVNRTQFEDRDGRYVIEDGAILTDDNSCKVRYIHQVTDPAKFSPMFAQALAARLAAEFAIPLAQSRSLQQDMFDIYSAKLREAAAVDGMQGKQRRIRSRWLHDARNSGYLNSTAGPEV